MLAVDGRMRIVSKAVPIPNRAIGPVRDQFDPILPGDGPPRLFRSGLGSV
jgi:hypothetical protein